MLSNLGIVAYFQALSAYLISPRKVRVFGVIGGVVGGRDLAGGRGDVVGSEGRGKEGSGRGEGGEKEGGDEWGGGKCTKQGDAVGPW